VGLLNLLQGGKARWLAATVRYLACFASMNVYMKGFAQPTWSLADAGKLPSSLAQRTRHGCRREPCCC
jgi:amino acid efflux transporter